MEKCLVVIKDYRHLLAIKQQIDKEKMFQSMVVRSPNDFPIIVYYDNMVLDFILPNMLFSRIIGSNYNYFCPLCSYPLEYYVEIDVRKIDGMKEIDIDELIDIIKGKEVGNGILSTNI